MRLAWVTDIHLNFLKPPQVEAFFAEIAAAKPDAVLVGGDIAVAPTLERFLLQLEATVGRPTFFVLGNHDFWGSSVAKVRAAMTALSARAPHLRWLGADAVFPLTARTGLVGHDGWADGRLGDYAGSRVFMNDFARVDDFAYMGKDARLRKLGELGDEAAAHLRACLPGALERFEHVVVLTHVPPFREAAWHEGAVSGDEWLPFMSCRATGDAIAEAARAFPARRLTVLCGHTHGAGEAAVLPNVRVRTGGAVYGRPELQPELVVD